MNNEIYTFSTDTHRGKNVILISFKYTQKNKEALRKRFPSVRWSQTKKSWYLPDLPVVRQQLGMEPKSMIQGKMMSLSATNQKAYAQMYDQLQLKGYSDNTKRIYMAEFYHLLKLLKSYPVDRLDSARLKDYFLHCVKKEGMGERKLNGKINAVKFYFEQVLHRPKMFFDIPRPKKPLVLPKLLSKEQVAKVFNATDNLKHLVALKLCYGAGLRVSEVVNIKLNDVDSARMVIHVVGAKGKKDRYVPLPEKLLPLLREYFKKYRPKEYLFEGKYGGAYSKSSVQQVFKKAMKIAGIRKKIGIHGLRHSYATHLLESGADMRFIQELLGHNSITTTQVYTKVTPQRLSMVKSPLDSM
ncbi:tyrosine-type recombinase/integrase [Maribacter sp. MAR_2009_72]|uniref:tyrosine-type recombinase/integrase n=1 Tax=Maribacter sp. MAR_2009_72 TaxID=1250050 RepID=UPI0011A58492|nr:tyrosine-type recombinase/integrase [Maribacter sp. MAR_2009_72]